MLSVIVHPNADRRPDATARTSVADPHLVFWNPRMEKAGTTRH
jgi:hypothetical protein